MNNVHFTNDFSFQTFRHLNIKIDAEHNAVWVYLNSAPRPCITVQLLEELKVFQKLLMDFSGRLPLDGKLIDIRYHILTSDHPVFNFGGDLDHFLNCIETNDVKSLREYGYACIDTMYPNLMGFYNDITTISLVHGNALGGGFEAALSSHVVIAEKGVEMGLPEVLFNLFPGMGAFNLLSQKTSPAMAEKMMLSGKLYTAEEMYSLNIVDILSEPGEGKQAVYHYMNSVKTRRNSQTAIRKVRQLVNPVSYQQLLEICDIWVDAAFKLSDRDKRIMRRLVNSQHKYSENYREEMPKKVTAL